MRSARRSGRCVPVAVISWDGETDASPLLVRLPAGPLPDGLEQVRRRTLLVEAPLVRFTLHPGDRALVAPGERHVELLTLAFEAALAFALGMPLSRLVQDYDLGQGGLMAFGMAWLVCVPWVAARLRQVRG